MAERFIELSLKSTLKVIHNKSTRNKDCIYRRDLKVTAASADLAFLGRLSL